MGFSVLHLQSELKKLSPLAGTNTFADDHSYPRVQPGHWDSCLYLGMIHSARLIVSTIQNSYRLGEGPEIHRHLLWYGTRHCKKLAARCLISSYPCDLKGWDRVSLEWFMCPRAVASRWPKEKETDVRWRLRCVSPPKTKQQNQLSPPREKETVYNGARDESSCPRNPHLGLSKHRVLTW